jgi:hypothetical protein
MLNGLKWTEMGTHGRVGSGLRQVVVAARHVLNIILCSTGTVPTHGVAERWAHPPPRPTPHRDIDHSTTNMNTNWEGRGRVSSRINFNTQTARGLTLERFQAGIN